MNKTTYKVGAVYPDDVLQNIACEMAMLHTFVTQPIAHELDPRPSFALWIEVEYFVMYVIESAVWASEQLHPSSRSRLAYLLIEEWIASRKPCPNPSSGIVARTVVSLVLKTGFNDKLFRNGYGKLCTEFDEFLNSPRRKNELKNFGDLSVLMSPFFSRVRRERTTEGRPIRFSGTETEFKSLNALIAKCFARANDCILYRAY